ncbi:MAG: DUF4381 domain-containing protein [Gammaproteobacteria bacterium]|nr:DUF4381 domain-containing protein [Gammaproteobacteria bacterium]
MAADLIHQLRDIHYPPPVPIWPLAVGWYYVFGFLLIIMAVICYWWLKTMQKRRLKKIVLHRLEQLQVQQDSQQNIAEELSMLLKRVALAIYPRREVAGLYGEEWLRFLDKTSLTTEFSQGAGRLLVIYPYQGKAEPLPEQLFHLIKNWVKKNL